MGAQVDSDASGEVEVRLMAATSDAGWRRLWQWLLSDLNRASVLAGDGPSEPGVEHEGLLDIGTEARAEE